ncbi:hypothetical protein T492DRAFT_867427 [Pavlovales sp. CCMP2436]|nr:hypothetical protein T492DRAFT_867427 [Pavlovales sp. CCMP2436]
MPGRSLRKQVEPVPATRSRLTPPRDRLPARESDARRLSLQRRQAGPLFSRPSSRRDSTNGSIVRQLVRGLSGRHTASPPASRRHLPEEHSLREIYTLGNELEGYGHDTGGALDGSIVLRDAKTHRVLRAVQRGDRDAHALPSLTLLERRLAHTHGKYVGFSVACSSDGKWVASGGGDGDRSIKLWAVTGGTQGTPATGDTGAAEGISPEPHLSLHSLAKGHHPIVDTA